MIRLTRKQQFIVIGIITAIAVLWAVATLKNRGETPEDTPAQGDQIPEGYEGDLAPDADGPPPDSGEYPGDWDMGPGGPDDEGEAPFEEEPNPLPRERSL